MYFSPSLRLPSDLPDDKEQLDTPGVIKLPINSAGMILCKGVELNVPKCQLLGWKDSYNTCVFVFSVIVCMCLCVEIKDQPLRVFFI